jgi:hypothetical protein
MALSSLFAAGSTFGNDLHSQAQIAPTAPIEIALEKFRQYALPQTQNALSTAVLYANPASPIAGGCVSLNANNLAMNLADGAVSRYFSDNRSLSMVSGSPTNLDLSAMPVRAHVQAPISAIQASVVTPTVDYNTAAQRFAEFTAPGTILVLVPEPSTWVMTIMGAGLLLSVQRFRKKKR